MTDEVTMRSTKSSILAKIRSILGITITLVVIGILFPLLFIEMSAHIFPDLIPAEIKTSVFQIDPPYKVLQPDEVLGYKFAPNIKSYPISFEDKQYSVSTVSLGYSDIGFRDDGIDGEIFAVVVGDSFANCAGVELENCWVELLEKATGQDFANLSVLGYGPQQEERMLTQYGLPLKPKLVLWTFYANDLKDAWRFNKFGAGAARNSEFWQSPVRTWLVKNSVVYTTFVFFWSNRFFFYNQIFLRDETKPSSPSINWWLANTDPAIPEVSEGLLLTQASILEAKNQTLAYDENTEFIVVILPFREQVYADTDLRLRFDSTSNDLIDFLEQNGIIVIDLTPDLRERTKTEVYPLFFEEDIHLNTKGNEVVAELLQQKLAVVLSQLSEE